MITFFLLFCTWKVRNIWNIYLALTSNNQGGLDTRRFLIAALRNEFLWPCSCFQKQYRCPIHYWCDRFGGLFFRLKVGTISLDPVWRVIAWSLNVSSAFSRNKVFCEGHFGIMQIKKKWQQESMCQRTIIWFQAAFAGIFPSKDAWGQDLPEPRASMAGKPLFGGPWALTEIRQGGHMNISHHTHNIPNMFPIYLPRCRGDWKWLKESWHLKHWWKYRAGICFKCMATGTPGPNLSYGCKLKYSFVAILPQLVSKTLHSWNIFVILILERKYFRWSITMWLRFHDVDGFASIPRLSPAEFISKALKLDGSQKTEWDFVFELGDYLSPYSVWDCSWGMTM